MKSSFLYISCIMLLTACNSSYPIDNIKKVLHNKELALSEAIETIDKVRSAIDKGQLKKSTKSQMLGGVENQYTIYSNKEMPLIIESETFGGSYTINTTYYIYDSIPYYINGMMRDQYRQTGNFTHQEQVIYLNGHKVIQQLKRATTNKEDRKVDLSNIAYTDATANLIHPVVDAMENINTIKEILSLPKE